MFPHSFQPDDVTVLLDPVVPDYLSTEERKALIAAGKHYNELLSREAEPDEFYFKLFQEQVVRLAEPMACLFKRLGLSIIIASTIRQVSPVLVSLVRAGTPTGVVLRRSLALMGMDAPHYTVSIVQGKGFDVAAIRHILAQGYKPEQLFFIDGWTGKGAVRRELSTALKSLSAELGTFHDELFVLSDIAGVADHAATREDVLIPSALLSGPVSGLISRTLYRGEDEQRFHGAAVLDYLAPYDRSLWFVEVMAEAVRALLAKQYATIEYLAPATEAADAMANFMNIAMKRLGVTDPSRIKPGIGEASRLFLRKTPTALIVADPEHPDVKHLLALAHQHSVPVHHWPDIKLKACAVMP